MSASSQGGTEVHGDSSGIAAVVKEIAYYVINVNRSVVILWIVFC